MNLNWKCNMKHENAIICLRKSLIIIIQIDFGTFDRITENMYNCTQFRTFYVLLLFTHCTCVVALFAGQKKKKQENLLPNAIIQFAFVLQLSSGKTIPSKINWNIIHSNLYWFIKLLLRNRNTIIKLALTKKNVVSILLYWFELASTTECCVVSWRRRYLWNLINVCVSVESLHTCVWNAKNIKW